ncbi:sigma-70 family RNA polymerase sigma factor, partial [Tyzzerella sp. OttesenSCG-928-J15]|nr:sigma-70 family RNA polymerase sigma factor [Tyzzerella sp. OttesenSCG-928-J15]
MVTELYELYQKAMFYEAKNILRDNALAEDAVHSAFERVMKNLHKVKENPPHKTKRFLVIIVRNVSIDMYNKIKNQDTTPIDNLYSLGDARADIEKMYITKETYEIAMSELK